MPTFLYPQSVRAFFKAAFPNLSFTSSIALYKLLFLSASSNKLVCTGLLVSSLNRTPSNLTDLFLSYSLLKKRFSYRYHFIVAKGVIHGCLLGESCKISKSYFHRNTTRQLFLLAQFITYFINHSYQLRH